MSRANAALLTAVLVLLAAIPASAQSTATLTVGSGSGLPGSTVDIPVNLTIGSAIVGTLQFDVTLPASLSASSVSAGTATTAAGKAVYTNGATAGLIRVVVYGGASGMGSGSVSVIRIAIAAGSAPATLALPITGVVVADNNALGIASTGVNGSLRVQDNSAPALSAVTVSSIGSTGATISWTTNELSDTRLRYGLSTAYGSDVVNSTMVSAHSVILTGLTPAATYYYQASSTDGSGNIGVSAGLFTTLAPADTIPPTISGPSVTNITASAATISWTTNETADTQVYYGLSNLYGAQAGSTSLVTSHSWTLTGLASGTPYHYKVTSTDAAKNTGSSADLTFVTADGTPPVISGVSAGAATSTSVTITWTTNEASDSLVQYGTSTSYGKSASDLAMSTSHSVALLGLTASTTYHFQVISKDTAGNRSVSGDATFITTSTPDTNPPMMSNIGANNVTDSAALITWATDEAADSVVQYGLTTAYEKPAIVDSSLLTSHAVNLGGLAASTTYHYHVKSKDASGNVSTSGDYVFATPAAKDTTPPVVSAVAASSLSATGATITWTTDEPSDSQVDYGTSSAYGKTSGHTATVTSHSVVLTGLTASTLYHYRVRSTDASNNAVVSGDATFSTTQSSDSTPPVLTALTLGKVTSAGAVVTWKTDEASDSQVEYGLSSNLGKVNKLSRTQVVSHSSAISGLKKNTTYYLRAKSRDAAGNLGVSETVVFTTTSSSGTALNLYYPRLVSQDGTATGLLDGSEYTGFAVVNLGSDEEVLTFTAYDRDGAEISGEDVANPAAITLASGTQLPVVDVELFGSGMSRNGRVGWIKLESSGTSVSGFTLMFNSSLTVLDGAPAFVTPFVSSVLTEIEDEGFNQIHIANPNEDQVPVLLDLVQQDGSVRASASRIVNANGVVAEYLNELFPDTPAVAGDYIRIVSAKGVIPFQMLGKTAQYLEGLNGQDSSQGATSLYSPQYAVGGPWRSTISIVNLDPNPGTVTFRLVGDDGAQIGATRVMHIAGSGKVYLKDQAFFVSPGSGFVQGYVQITSDVKLTGSVLFGDPERRAFAAALPLASTLQESAVFSQIASNQTYFTGLAILNPSDANAAVTLEVYAADGSLQGTVTETIRPRERVSKLLTEYFPEMAGQNRGSGYVRMYSDRPVASFALFGTHDLSVLSAVPAQTAP